MQPGSRAVDGLSHLVLWHLLEALGCVDVIIPAPFSYYGFTFWRNSIAAGPHHGNHNILPCRELYIEGVHGREGALLVYFWTSLSFSKTPLIGLR